MFNKLHFQITCCPSLLFCFTFRRCTGEHADNTHPCLSRCQSGCKLVSLLSFCLGWVLSKQPASGESFCARVFLRDQSRRSTSFSKTDGVNTSLHVPRLGLLVALVRAGAFTLNFKTAFVFGSSVHPCGHVSWKPARETAAHLYPERGGMYFNIPLASLQRALIINKLGTRHGVPQGDQPEQWRNRETDRKEESNREREEKTGKIRR